MQLHLPHEREIGSSTSGVPDEYGAVRSNDGKGDIGQTIMWVSPVLYGVLPPLLQCDADGRWVS